jgi:uncharacterized protein
VTTPSPAPRRFAARRSPIHGRGVFALTDIAPGEILLEYRGARISAAEAAERFHAAGAPAHTFLFSVSDDEVIDGGEGGNSARWINHGCAPNCEAVDRDGRIFIEALVPIPAGAELLIDYRLEIDEYTDPDGFPCSCGAPTCRRTMLG